MTDSSYCFEPFDFAAGRGDSRHRTRLLIGLGVGVVVLLLAFYQATGVVHSGANTNAFIHAVFVLILIWTTLLALVVVIQITVMTKRILRAIELASKK